jgi:hypothetical protein
VKSIRTHYLWRMPTDHGSQSQTMCGKPLALLGFSDQAIPIDETATCAKCCQVAKLKSEQTE